MGRCCEKIGAGYRDTEKECDGKNGEGGPSQTIF